MRSPKEIIIGKKNEGTKNVRHVYYMVHAKDKYLALKRIADYNPNIYGIIFCRTRKETQEIADLLIKDGYNADSLHGDLSQQQRDYVMHRFRVNNIQLLVATDVAARGLDVDELTHVINYGLPDDVESYTHRSGRTGRAGRTGTSVSIIHLKEKHKVREIEKIINRNFEEGIIPTGDQICEKQLFTLVDKIEKVKVNEEEIAPLMPSIFRKLDWLDKEDIVKRVISLEFNRLIDYYRQAGDIETPSFSDRGSNRGGRGDNNRGDKRRGDRRNEEGNGGGRGAEKGYTRLFINLGRTDRIKPQDIIGLLNDNIPGKKVDIGRIDLMKNFSFFEVKNDDGNKVIKALKNVDFFGRKVSVEQAQEAPSEDRQKKIDNSKKYKNSENYGGGKNKGDKREKDRRDKDKGKKNYSGRK